MTSDQRFQRGGLGAFFVIFGVVALILAVYSATRGLGYLLWPGVPNLLLALSSYLVARDIWRAKPPDLSLAYDSSITASGIPPKEIEHTALVRQVKDELRAHAKPRLVDHEADLQRVANRLAGKKTEIHDHTKGEVRREPGDTGRFT